MKNKVSMLNTAGYVYTYMYMYMYIYIYRPLPDTPNAAGSIGSNAGCCQPLDPQSTPAPAGVRPRRH